MTARSTPCSLTRARTSRYLDGELQAGSRAHVQDHLRRCPACLVVFRQTLELARRARELPRRCTPTDLAERARTESARRRAARAEALTDGHERPTPPLLHRRRAAAAAAVLILVAAIAFAIGRLTAPAPPAPSDQAATPTVDSRPDAGADREPGPPSRDRAPSPPDGPSRPDPPRLEPRRYEPPRFEPPPTRAELVHDRAGERRR